MTQCVTTFSSLSPYSIGTGWLPKETGHTGLPFRGIVQVSLVWHKSSRTRAVVSRCHRKSCFYNTTSDKSSFFFGLGILGIFNDTNFCFLNWKNKAGLWTCHSMKTPPPSQHTHTMQSIYTVICLCLLLTLTFLFLKFRLFIGTVPWHDQQAVILGHAIRPFLTSILNTSM